MQFIECNAFKICESVVKKNKSLHIILLMIFYRLILKESFEFSSDFFIQKSIKITLYLCTNNTKQ